MAGSPLPPHSLQTPTAAALTPPGELCRSSSAAVPRRCGGPTGRRGSGGAGGPRQSASEREKLRMRRLAQAMLRLRHYLPPALAPAGQSLTKIETLRLATRYIAHLSALLGLSEEVLLLRRGTAPRRCPLCPQGLGCCQPPRPRLRPSAPRDALCPGSGAWGTPPERHAALDVGTGTWGSLSDGAVLESHPELRGTPGPVSQPSPSALCSIGAVTPLEPPRRRAAATGTGTAPSCCMEPAAPSLHPGLRAKAMGHPGLPTCGSQIGSPLDLDVLVSSDAHGSPVLPGCSPTRCWGWWSRCGAHS
ncbi:mesoderm posterior protein 1-like [Cyrtonyx montezumae]|uniref:mesoderm posterior protein 1-like n=1 Tax=Cyrtonyx montezumae TaxID=9017 RepID=UPI0032DA4475